jgi:hypothetical protein
MLNVVLLKSVIENFMGSDSCSSGRELGNYVSKHTVLFAVSNTAMKKDNPNHKWNVYCYLKAVSVQEKSKFMGPSDSNVYRRG